jgi:hypothetical protein
MALIVAAAVPIALHQRGRTTRLKTTAPVSSTPTLPSPRVTTSQTVPAPVPAARLSQPAAPARAVIGRIVYLPSFYAAATGVYLSDLNILNGTTVSTELLRIDPITGVVLARLVLAGAYGQALLVGGNLWVISNTELHVGVGRSTLLAVDPSTLAVRLRLALPTAPAATFAPDAIAAAGGELWIAGSSTLYRVAPATATVSAAVPVAGAARTTIGANPTGTVLVDGESTEGGVWRVQRRNPTTGALLAQTATSIGVTSPTIGGIVATGVWISDHGGMMGGAERLDLATLNPIATSEISGSNGVDATVIGDRLWVTQPGSGSVRNYCADPVTGTVIARLTVAIAANDIILGFADGNVYYVNPHERLVTVDRAPIPTECDQ